MITLRGEIARLRAMPSTHQDAVLTSVVLWLVTAIFLIILPAGFVWVILGAISGGLAYVAGRTKSWWSGPLAALALLLLFAGPFFRPDLPVFLAYAELMPSFVATILGLYFLFTPAVETEMDRVLRRRVDSSPITAGPAKAPGYSWSCAKCRTSNVGDVGTCVKCGFPAFFDGRLLDDGGT